MKNESEEFFYAKIRDPVEFRKYVLECLKDVIQLLKRYEEFKRVREKKIEYAMLLKNNLGELAKLLSQFRLELPRVNIKGTVKGTLTKLSYKTSPKERIQSNINVLEGELEDIESKLKGLV